MLLKNYSNSKNRKMVRGFFDKFLKTRQDEKHETFSFTNLKYNQKVFPLDSTTLTFGIIPIAQKLSIQKRRTKNVHVVMSVRCATWLFEEFDRSAVRVVDVFKYYKLMKVMNFFIQWNLEFMLVYLSIAHTKIIKKEIEPKKFNKLSFSIFLHLITKFAAS